MTVGGASRKSLDSQPLSQSKLRIAHRGEVLSHRPIDALASGVVFPTATGKSGSAAQAVETAPLIDQQR